MTDSRERVIHKVRLCVRRWRIQRLWKTFQSAVVWSFILACLLESLDKILPQIPNPWLLSCVFMMGFMIFRGAPLLTSKTRRVAVRETDTELKLKDALTSAFERLTMPTDPWTDAIIMDCAQRFPTSLPPLDWRVPAKRLAVTACCFFVLALLQLVRPREYQETPQPPTDEISRQAEKLSREISPLAQGPSARQLSQRIRQFARDLAEGKIALADQAKQAAALDSQIQEYCARLSPNEPNDNQNSKTSDSLSGSGSGAGEAPADLTQTEGEILASLARSIDTFQNTVIAQSEQSQPSKSQTSSTLDLQDAPASASAPISSPVDLSAHPNNTPWEEIPFWQRPVVKRYFSLNETQGTK